MPTKRERLREMADLNWDQAMDWINVITALLSEEPVKEFVPVQRLCQTLTAAGTILTAPQLDELRELQRTLAPNPTPETRIGIVGVDADPEEMFDRVIGPDLSKDAQECRRACLAYVYFSFLLDRLQGIRGESRPNPSWN